MKRGILSSGILFTIVTLCGCSADQSGHKSGTNLNRPLRLAFITCSVEGKFFEPLQAGMKDAARRMGVRADFMGTRGVDIPAQVEMVRQAVKDGYDGIALNIIDPVAFDSVIQEIIDKGVPLVAFNVDDNTTANPRLSGVSQRFVEAGKKLAAHLLPSIPENSHVLMTLHDSGISALDDRQKGMQEVLKTKNIRWTPLVSGNDSAKGAEVIAAALEENPDIRIVLGSGQSDTEAAGRAIRQNFAGRGYWAAGFDLSPTTLELIRQGHIRCTIDQQPYIQGFYPVIQLTLLIRYGIIPSDIDAGAAIIDASNVEQVVELSKQHIR
ncbi:MAG: substrate-binding domain-containing protein [Phycisphaerae bacterium]|nr:substrate-binding domain-containing protein [Phycisphaerae bacterium]